MDSLAVSGCRWVDRCRTDDNDVPRARRFAVAGFADLGARVRQTLAASRRIPSHSLVVFVEGEKDRIANSLRLAACFDLSDAIWRVKRSNAALGHSRHFGPFAGCLPMPQHRR